jgi:phosphatidylglycerophosphatase A
VASGTVGTLATLPLVLLLAWSASPALYAGVTLLVIAAGVWASGGLARELGRKDPGEAVIDESAGILVTMAFLPMAPWLLVAGFLLFRVLDIAKPFPARRLERLPGGWGIMADDLVVALYAHGLLRLGLWLLES